MLQHIHHLISHFFSNRVLLRVRLWNLCLCFKPWSDIFFRNIIKIVLTIWEILILFKAVIHSTCCHSTYSISKLALETVRLRTHLIPSSLEKVCYYNLLSPCREITRFPLLYISLFLYPGIKSNTKTIIYFCPSPSIRGCQVISILWCTIPTHIIIFQLACLLVVSLNLPTKVVL